MKTKICVIGAGVMGLSSAVCLQNTLQNIEVSIVAEKFSPNTTSDGSGGFWEPHLVSDSQEASISDWGKTTFDYILELVRSSSAAEIGAQLVSGYNFAQDTPEEQNPSWKNVVLGFRLLTSKEIQTIYPEAKGGTTYTTVMLDVKHYLPWLMKKFRINGGKTVHKKLKSLDEWPSSEEWRRIRVDGVIYMMADALKLSIDYDIIVNCSGIGAGQIVDDQSLQPIRGQVIKVFAPVVKHFYASIYEEAEVYILPGAHGVTLGGTFQTGNWSTDISQSDRDRIWNGCVKMCPSLQGAKIIHDWVGLRPSRPSIRLEAKYRKMKNGNKQLVVHNYGHGGSGITLHWGCALEVVKLVSDILHTSKSTSKL